MTVRTMNLYYSSIMNLQQGNDDLILHKEASNIDEEEIRNGSFYLGARGIKKANGEWVSYHFIRNLIHDTSYIGYSSKYGCDRIYDPIISKELFDRCQQVMKNNMTQQPKATKYHYFGIKLIKCPVCGYNFVAQAKTYHCFKHSQRAIYDYAVDNEVCDNSINIGVHVIDGLLWRIASEAHIVYLYNLSSENKSSSNGEQKEIGKEVKKEEPKIEGETKKEEVTKKEEEKKKEEPKKEENPKKEEIKETKQPEQKENIKISKLAAFLDNDIKESESVVTAPPKSTVKPTHKKNTKLDKEKQREEKRQLLVQLKKKEEEEREKELRMKQQKEKEEREERERQKRLEAEEKARQEAQRTIIERNYFIVKVNKTETENKKNRKVKNRK